MLWKGFLAFNLIFPSLAAVLLLLCLFDPSWWVVQGHRTCSLGFLQARCCYGDRNCTTILRDFFNESSGAESSSFYLILCALIFIVIAVLINILTIWTNFIPRVLVGVSLCICTVCTIYSLVLYAYNHQNIIAGSLIANWEEGVSNPGQTFFAGVLACVVLAFASTVGLIAERKSWCHTGRFYDQIETNAVMVLTQQ